MAKKIEATEEKFPNGYLWVPCSPADPSKGITCQQDDFIPEWCLLVSIEPDHPQMAELLVSMVSENEKFAFPWASVQPKWEKVVGALLPAKYLMTYPMYLQRAGIEPFTEVPWWVEETLKVIGDATNAQFGEIDLTMMSSEDAEAEAAALLAADPSVMPEAT